MLTIIEPSGDGHRFYYCSLVARAVPGDVVLLTDVEWITSDEYARHLKPLGSKLSTEVLERDAVVPEALRRADAGATVLIPDADRHLMKFLALGARNRRVRRTRCRLLVMRPPRLGAATLRGRLKASVIHLLRAQGYLVFELESPFAPHSTRWGVVDPTPARVSDRTKVEARAYFRVDSQFLLAIVGRIDERKRLDLVLEALRDPRLAHVGLLVAGRASAQVVPLLAAPEAEGLATAGRLIVMNRVLDEAELDDAIAGADAILLLQPGGYSSGTMLRALAAATPIVGREDLPLSGPARHWVSFCDGRSASSIVDAVLAALSSRGSEPLYLADPQTFVHTLVIGGARRDANAS